MIGIEVRKADQKIRLSGIKILCNHISVGIKMIRMQVRQLLVTIVLNSVFIPDGIVTNLRSDDLREKRIAGTCDNKNEEVQCNIVFSKKKRWNVSLPANITKLGSSSHRNIRFEFICN